MTCPECNGTGEYRGLNVVEPCSTCRFRCSQIQVMDSFRILEDNPKDILEDGRRSWNWQPSDILVAYSVDDGFIKCFRSGKEDLNLNAESKILLERCEFPQIDVINNTVSRICKHDRFMVLHKPQYLVSSNEEPFKGLRETGWEPSKDIFYCTARIAADLSARPEIAFHYLNADKDKYTFFFHLEKQNDLIVQFVR